MRIKLQALCLFLCIFLQGCMHAPNFGSDTLQTSILDPHIYQNNLPLSAQNRVTVTIKLKVTNSTKKIQQFQFKSGLLILGKNTFNLEDVKINNSQFPHENWDNFLLPNETTELIIVAYSDQNSASEWSCADIVLHFQNSTETILLNLKSICIEKVE
jgi:hypothetical protein